MPYYQEHCDPQLVLVLAEGTRICQDYKDGDSDQPLTEWYQFPDDSSLSGWTSFDVRDLPVGGTNSDRLRAAGYAAVQAGLSFRAYLSHKNVKTYESYG